MKDTRYMRCWNCGFPRAIGYLFHWHDDGTISPFMTRELRAVILHADMINDLLDDIEKRYGVSVEEIAFNTQRSVMSLMLPVLAERMKVARFMLDFLPLKGGGMSTFLAIARRGGFAAVEVVQYKPGRHMKVNIKNPININLVTAMIVSAAEFFDGGSYKYSCEEKSENEYTLKLDAVRGERVVVETVTLDTLELAPGGAQQRRCSNCNVPLGVSAHFEAAESDGIIIDRHTESRIIIIEGRIFMVLLDEIAKRTGIERTKMLSEIYKKWTMDKMGLLGLKARIRPLSSREVEKEFEKKLMDLPVFGLGCAIESIVSRSGARVVVLNPYSPELIGGMLEGIYEVLTGNKGRMTWEELDRGEVAFTVK